MAKTRVYLDEAWEYYMRYGEYKGGRVVEIDADPDNLPSVIRAVRKVDGRGYPVPKPKPVPSPFSLEEEETEFFYLNESKRTSHKCLNAHKMDVEAIYTPIHRMNGYIRKATEIEQ